MASIMGGWVNGRVDILTSVVGYLLPACLSALVSGIDFPASCCAGTRAMPLYCRGCNSAAWVSVMYILSKEGKVSARRRFACPQGA